MVVTEPNDILYPISINLGRPDIFNEDDRDYWRRIHELIKTSDINILVNPMFPYLDDRVNTENYKMSGGGFQYLFWFMSDDDKKEFMKSLKQLL